MSLLLPDRLLVALAPGELSWVRLTGMFKPQVRDQGTVAVAHGYGARAWDGAIAALRAQLAPWRNDRLAVRMVLSNHFVRYALVPYSKDIRGAEQERALALHHFAKVHGEASRGWDIRLSPARRGASRLASAVDSALIDAMKQSFPLDRRLRLASLQPLLMSVFNGGGVPVPQAGAWLIIAEPDRACLALLSGNTWHAVQNVKGHYADAEAWIGLVERERWRVALDTVPDTLLVHSPQAPSLAGRTYGTWKVMGLPTRWPQGLLPTRDSRYSAALSAA